MRQPILRSKRLTLQPAKSNDVIPLQALWSQPEVRRFLFDDRDVSFELAESVLGSALACAPSGYGLWLVYLENQPEILGCVGLMPATTAAEYESGLAGLLEPVVALAAVHWHKGYAQEALSEVLTYAFDRLQQPCLCAVNDVPNVASERMLKKLGFDILSEVQGPKYRLRTYQLPHSSWMVLNHA
ncbi:GNAT family N-acetyltransferase [Exilibacterium tricleocarpae]|uniref:GNAT family N-acetyltransferase n=1 Tax=Exilibacterium tricleocarpae TaxID=2591008 RepID=A0A545T0C6_9GAMM|nr:GNAT family N-acetyltransferase [Exilibacterium tricleocarpae]TQV70674.1 GNAT family N-acetyltransferase [Exilibacterium tricleocarpae]